MIEIKNLKKVYDNDLTALDNINLSIKKGELISILGPSGCGKSTLLKLVSGMIAPTEGSVSFYDKPVNKDTLEKLDFMLQTHALLPWRTVNQNIKLSLEVNKKKINEKIVNAMTDMVGLKGFENSYPSELSEGMKQRVALARALINNPEVLLMDEPWASLDIITRERLNLELLRIWKVQGFTALVVTHAIEGAVFLADRIIVLSDRPGKIKADIKIELERPRKRDSAKFRRYVECVRKNME